MKHILTGLVIGLLVGCASFSTNTFRSEQSAANLATTAYIAYTNGLNTGVIKVTTDQSNNIRGLRLKFGASLKAVEGWRSAYETNSALQPTVTAALNALLSNTDNLINAINTVEGK